LPGGKLLSFASPKASNQRKGDPTSPAFGFPQPEPAGRAAQNSPRFCLIPDVSGAQTCCAALFRPSDSDFGGDEGEEIRIKMFVTRVILFETREYI
jgi:hypothetical protein